MTILTSSPFRGFVNSPYLADSDGVLRAVMPASCPKARVEGSCCIRRFALRERVCGPGYLLELFHCTNHEVHFTVYPPGWIPHKRAPLVFLAPDGSAILCDDAASNKNSYSVWSFSLFKGVIAAGMGVLWPEEKQLGVEAVVTAEFSGVTKTQKRMLKLFMKIFGVARLSHRKLRERVSSLLNLPIVLFENSRKKMNGRSRDPPLWRIRGESGKGILESIAASERNFHKVLILMNLAVKNTQSPQ
jgi:hypothetical protein